MHQSFVHNYKSKEVTFQNIIKTEDFEEEKPITSQTSDETKTINKENIAQNDVLKVQISTVHDGKKPFKCELC